MDQSIETFTVLPGTFKAALARVARTPAPVLLMCRDAVLAPGWAPFVHAAHKAWAGGAALDVAGASLSVPRFLPLPGRVPFVPIEDGQPVFWSRELPRAAAFFTPEQAERLLVHWRGEGDQGIDAALSATGSFLACPRSALAHDGGGGVEMQRLLACGERRWRFGRPQSALAVYDAGGEITSAAVRRIGLFPEHDFTVDLWQRGAPGPGPEHMLSARPCRRPLLQFALEFVPIEANLARAIDEGFFSFGLKQDFGPPCPERQQSLVRHATRYNDMSAYFSQILQPLRRVARVFN